MSVAAYCEHLSALGAHRARALRYEGVLGEIYVYLGPDRVVAEANRGEAERFRRKGVRGLWGWWVCSPDQEADVQGIQKAHEAFQPDGWLLNIEKPLEGAKLGTLISGVQKLGVPVRASLAGVTASHISYDYRALDRASIPIEWQAYLDSGEGPSPRVAVQEMFRSTFVVDGWEYRSLIGDAYGWGRMIVQDIYQSYLTGSLHYKVSVQPREWGWTLVSRNLLHSGRAAGKLLGRARWRNIRVVLDVTRGAAGKRTLDEWTALAASARLPGLTRRPVSVYLAEVCPDDVLRAIARGAGT